jgi:hypothetical protein
MKRGLYVIPVCLMLAFVSTSSFAYSGSECEVQDCSSPKPTKAKAKNAPPKEQAKDQAKDKAAQEKNTLSDKMPTSLKKATDLFK